MFDDEYFDLSCPDALVDRRFEIKKSIEPVSVRDKAVESHANVAVPFEWLFAVAEGAEVHAKIHVERRPPLGALEIENGDGLAALLSPSRSRFFKAALLKCRSKCLLKAFVVFGGH